MDTFIYVCCKTGFKGKTLTIINKVFPIFQPRYFILGSILLLAGALRFLFFIGFAGGDPQDDGIYLNICRDILNTGFPNHVAQKLQVVSQPLVNPVYIFPSRLVFVYSTALSLRLFGINDYAAVLFPFLCSMGSIWLVYKLGLLLFSPRAGFYAALTLSLCPLDVLFATRITPDVPVAFFILASMYFFLKGMLKNHASNFIAAGVIIGLGYFVKETIFIGLLTMVVLFAVETLRKRRMLPKALLILIGILMCFLFEGGVTIK